MSAIATATLLTADEYCRLPDNGPPTELVRGEVIELPQPTPRHGELCFKIGCQVQRYLETHPVGRIVSNDAGVITERDPDTVRGPDVAYYSFEKIPAGPMPDRYVSTPPDIAFEVRSKSDRWKDLLNKVSEYLSVGVRVVVVIDPTADAVQIYRDSESPSILNIDDALELPDVLPGFRMTVRQLFS
jgi:Uma2 family endonuclease